MGQRYKKYWTTVSKKPKGFKTLGNNIYVYEMWFRVRNSEIAKYDYFKEIIPTQYEYTEIGNRKINTIEFIKSIKKITGVNISKEGGYIGEEIFRRDGILVPFVEYVTVPDDKGKAYLEYRDMRDRVRKINQLRNNIQ